jgi:hypothetical protein
MADDTNKSENSDNDGQKRIDIFMDFCCKHEEKPLDVLLINKNLIDYIGDKYNMYVIGSVTSKEMNKIIMSAYMKFSSNEMIDLSPSQKDVESFTNSQRYPIAISRVLAEYEELDGTFLHSIANINNPLNLGIIKRGNKLLMFKLTPTGVETIKKCKKEAWHLHGWKQINSENVIFFDENQLAKCIVEEREAHTKDIRRYSEYNYSITRVLNGVRVSEKI